MNTIPLPTDTEEQREIVKAIAKLEALNQSSTDAEI